ncbi:MAG TPA: hypothetical protein VNL17_07095 [Verrucomicrobiae bacterium]|nr:hypothetical protein [Verrucomicrobiae bacterium]
MSKAQHSEDLVLVHHARDEWDGNIIVGYLRDNGVEATLQNPPSMPPLDAMESLSGSDKVNGIFVLDHEASHARELVEEFVNTVTDEQVLEEAAAQKLKLDKETVTQLRGALMEERQTFEFLGWIGAAFLGAVALLWAIWPAWLKIGPPSPEFRWVVVILLLLAAVFVGSLTSRRP